MSVSRRKFYPIIIYHNDMKLHEHALTSIGYMLFSFMVDETTR